MVELMRENNEKTFAEYEKIVLKTFQEAHINEAQDILLIEGERPAFRVKGIISKMSHLPIWTIEMFDAFLLMAFPGKDNSVDRDSRIRAGGIFEEAVKKSDGSHDFNLTYGVNHLRCHMYSAFPKGMIGGKIRGIQAVINVRVVPKEMPLLGNLNLPDISPIFQKRSGLLLVSGRANDGKSTTVAAIVNEFNRMTDRQRVILTLEDPVEFVHKNNNAWVIQRRVGENVPSYARATEDAMREDADIVVIGELRKAEEMHNALRLAEVGKLVISTIHANGIEDTIERYVSEFSGDLQGQVRTRLKENLVGILHQNLIAVNNAQYPLASMMVIENEDAREILRQNGERGKLDKVIKKFGRCGVSREDGFNDLKKKGILEESDRKKYIY